VKYFVYGVAVLMTTGPVFAQDYWPRDTRMYCSGVSPQGDETRVTISPFDEDCPLGTQGQSLTDETRYHCFYVETDLLYKGEDIFGGPAVCTESVVQNRFLMSCGVGGIKQYPYGSSLSVVVNGDGEMVATALVGVSADQPDGEAIKIVGRCT